MHKFSRILTFLLVFIMAVCLACHPEASPISESTVPVSEPAQAPDPVAEETAEPIQNEEEYILSDPLLKSAVVPNDQSRVFYEIFVGSFSDSNGDGIGDLRGIINRIDYLNDGNPDSGKSLGIEGIWLTPIFKSPTYHKYDVSDYYAVDSQFGTEADLVELINLCHERNMLLILDLPLNHTGNRNAWFTAFRSAHQNMDESSMYYDFYTWYDSASESAPAGRHFSPIAGTTHYYECNFTSDMPELNLDNENVQKAVLDVAQYYINLGVDGFRFDAAKYAFFGEHKKNLDFWLWYLGTLREIKPDLYTVAEVWDSDGITDVYYPAVNCFNFTVSQTSGLIAESANKGDVTRYTSYVEKYLKNIRSMRENALYVPFIANHDTDRAAGYLTVASGAMQMAANLYLLGPGSPFIYYGEELGMRGSRGGANTDANRRLAMIWGDGDTIKNPEGTTYPAKNQIEFTAWDQVRQPSSLYTHYKKLLMIRRAYPAIAHGTYTALSNTGSKVGGFEASYGDETLLVLHNTTISEKSVDLSEVTSAIPDQLLIAVGLENASLDGSILTIGAQTSVVIRCK